jgi:hypothetical protein
VIIDINDSPSGVNGAINLFAFNTTDVILDINAFFAQ